MKRTAIIFFLLVVKMFLAQQSFYEKNVKILQETSAQLEQNLKKNPESLKEMNAFYKAQLPMKTQLQETSLILENYQKYSKQFLQKEISGDFLKYQQEYQNKLKERQDEWKQKSRSNIKFDFWERPFHAKNVENVWKRLLDLDEELFFIADKPVEYRNMERAVELWSEIEILHHYLEKYQLLQKKITPRQVAYIEVSSEMYWESISKKEPYK